LTKLSDKLKSNELLTMSILAGSLVFSCNIIAHFTLPQYRLYAILVGYAGLGASVAFWIPGVLTILTDFDKKRRAETYGMVSGIKSLGWMPTAVIAGIIIDKTIVRFGILIPFVISISLLPIEILLAIKFPVKEKEEKAEE
jgi:MFS family permease